MIVGDRLTAAKVGYGGNFSSCIYPSRTFHMKCNGTVTQQYCLCCLSICRTTLRRFFSESFFVDRCSCGSQVDQGVVLLGVHHMKGGVTRGLLTKDVRSADGWQIGMDVFEYVQVRWVVHGVLPSQQLTQLNWRNRRRVSYGAACTWSLETRVSFSCAIFCGSGLLYNARVVTQVEGKTTDPAAAWHWTVCRGVLWCCLCCGAAGVAVVCRR